MAASPDAARAYRLRTLFDMTIEDYETLLAYQGGHCALCPALPGRVRLAVDHDHKTGHVLGLLCANCNRRLGERVTAAWLAAAAMYLESPPAFAALGRIPQGRVGRVTKRASRRKKGLTRGGKR